MPEQVLLVAENCAHAMRGVMQAAWGATQLLNLVYYSATGPKCESESEFLNQIERSPLHPDSLLNKSKSAASTGWR